MEKATLNEILDVIERLGTNADLRRYYQAMGAIACLCLIGLRKE